MIRIFKIFVPTTSLALFSLELLWICASYALMVYLNPNIDQENFYLNQGGIGRMTVVVVSMVLALYLSGLYGDIRIVSRLQLVQQICFPVGLAFLAQAAIGLLNRNWIVPRTVMILGSVLVAAGVFCSRLLWQMAVSGNGVRPRRVLFMGASPAVQELAYYIERHPELGLRTLGYLEDHDAPGQAAHARLGSIEDWSRVVDENQPDWIVIGAPEKISPVWISELLELQFGGVQLKEATALYEALFSRVLVPELNRVEYFAESFRARAWNLNVQFVYAVPLALAALLVTLPLMAVLAVAARLSTGRILSRSPYVGLQGRLVMLYRFASTTREGKATWFGDFLSRSGLDKLPQLLNILSGDLSLVGPRPHPVEIASELERSIPHYKLRHSVKPGLTGWAQVNRIRGMDPGGDFRRSIEYDLYYVKNYSPALDLLILLGSAKSLLVQAA